MEDQLWNLFLETGDPMGYLLLKAEEKHRSGEAQPPALPGVGQERAAPASV